MSVNKKLKNTAITKVKSFVHKCLSTLATNFGWNEKFDIIAIKSLKHGP